MACNAAWSNKRLSSSDRLLRIDVVSSLGVSRPGKRII